ncbi:N-arachidonyl glycine receptor [Spea bombifrons]|uniref:N-arachidonyl glycine receptor n=1 Tax=Spea bombifrons TaxID=233779 RepID=UPI00234BC4A9|nr:N-arachidonyl glycine receptor [Spea bombifrons]
MEGVAYNQTEPHLPFNWKLQEYSLPALIYYSIVLPIGLLVNITALWVFSCTTKKRTTITVYMMNVALLDLMFLLFVPFFIIYYVKKYWLFGDIFCRILGVLTIFYPSVTLWLLAFISADRYMAIVQPKQIKELKNISKAMAACFGIWIMTLVTTTPLLFISDDQDKELNFTTCYKMLDIVHFKKNNVLNFARLIFFFLIPLLIMIGCYTIIIYSLLSGRTSRLKPKAKNKSIRIIVTLMVQVLVCFVPFHVCLLLLITHDEQEHYLLWGNVSTFLMYLSTCLDVILYYIVSKQFQARVLSVILYRNYLRSVRRKSVRSGSIHSLSNINSEMI